MATMNQFAADPNQKPKQPGTMRPQTGTGLQVRPPMQAGPSSGPIVDPGEMRKRLAGMPGLNDMDRRRLDEAAGRGIGAVKDAVRGRPFEMDVQQAINGAIGADQNKMGGARPAEAPQVFGGSSPGLQFQVAPGLQAGPALASPTASADSTGPSLGVSLPASTPMTYDKAQAQSGHTAQDWGQLNKKLKALDPALVAQWREQMQGIQAGGGRRYDFLNQMLASQAPQGQSPPFNPQAPGQTAPIPQQGPPIYTPPVNPNDPPTQIPDIFLPF